MSIRAIAAGLVSIFACLFALECFGKSSNPTSVDAKKAVAESLKIYRKQGVEGLKNAVAECWAQPRRYCLYLDIASQRIAIAATRRGIALDEYFYQSAVSERAHVWLSPNARRNASNFQYLRAVEQLIDTLLSPHLQKMIHRSQLLVLRPSFRHSTVTSSNHSACIPGQANSSRRLLVMV